LTQPEESADISQSDLHNVVTALHQKIKQHDFIVYAGQLPKGVADNTYAWLMDIAHEAGVSVNVGWVFSSQD
jgi:fructose-1-phosphate kinase PfkB-like protein